jgi:hypothetical protein
MEASDMVSSFDKRSTMFPPIENPRTALLRWSGLRPSTQLSRLHVWRLGPGHMGVTASLVAAEPQSPRIYKERLAGIAGLSHVTIEVHPCTPEAALHRH